MTRSVVDYENLLETSFSDSNASIKTSVRPRWERKKLREQERMAAAAAAKGAGGDRFIPNRAGMNMELSKHLMRSSSMDSHDGSDNMPADQKSVSDDKRSMYASNLSSALLGVDDVKGNRIMSYQEKAPAPTGDTVNNLNILYSASNAAAVSKKGSTKLVTRHIPSAPSRILDAPDLMDDYYLNLISWSNDNILAVALGQTVYLWNAGTGSIQELCTFESAGPSSHISSVAWVQQGGAHLAVGTSSGMTQLWDVPGCKQLRSMDGHSDRVGALAWNRHILSTGSRDATIVQHDVRVSNHIAATLSHQHTQEVCGLTWSPDGETLASGGNDNLLCLWDATASARAGPRFQFTDHQAAVKALAWSPHERNLLATGGGTADRSIKFWNTQTGALLNSIDTGSQVCALKWNPFEKEILSSHGYSRNQLTLWKYPSMSKIKEFEGHTARVLHMAVGPDGGTVLSAAADETLRFWDIFAPPAASKKRGTDFLSSSAVRGRKTTSWTTQIR